MVAVLKIPRNRRSQPRSRWSKNRSRMTQWELHMGLVWTKWNIWDSSCRGCKKAEQLQSTPGSLKSPTRLIPATSATVRQNSPWIDVAELGGYKHHKWVVLFQIERIKRNVMLLLVERALFCNLAINSLLSDICNWAHGRGWALHWARTKREHLAALAERQTTSFRLYQAQ